MLFSDLSSLSKNFLVINPDFYKVVKLFFSFLNTVQSIYEFLALLICENTKRLVLVMTCLTLMLLSDFASYTHHQ